MKTTRPSFCVRTTLIFSGVLWLCASWASAAIYLKFEGVEGESVDAQHLDWIDVLSVDWGFAMTGAPPVSAHAELVCTKELDKSSPKLAESVCNGTVYDVVDIDFTRTVRGSAEIYSHYRLYNCTVGSIRTHISGTNAPRETISLNYERIEWEYLRLDPASGAPLGRHAIYLARLLDQCFIDGDDINSDHDALTNDLDPDDDNDGIPDAYEDANGLIRFIDDADGDLDGDKMSNFAESIAGTSANDASSVFRMTTFRHGSNETGRLSWSSTPDHAYTVSRADLPGGPYLPFLFDLPSQGAVTFVDVPLGPGGAFYWVEVIQAAEPPLKQ